jgi:hypothetical protein
MSLQFLKNYNVTNLIEKNKEKLMAYKDIGYKGIYIAMDVLDMHLFRILSGYNEEYEKEDGVYLVEAERIPKYEVCEKLLETKNGINKAINSRNEVNETINKYNKEDILLCTLLIDAERGLENWENEKCFSLEEAIKIIDQGYGIINLN